MRDTKYNRSIFYAPAGVSSLPNTHLLCNFWLHTLISAPFIVIERDRCWKLEQQKISEESKKEYHILLQ